MAEEVEALEHHAHAHPDLAEIAFRIRDFHVVQPEMPVAYVRLDAPSNMLLKSVTFDTSKLEKLGRVTMLEHPLNMLAKLVTLEVFQLVVPVTLESDEQPSNIRAIIFTLETSHLLMSPSNSLF
jgi:hypothetical protein